MARFLILSGSNDHKHAELLLESEIFLDAYNKVVGLWEGKIKCKNDIEVEYARLAQQQKFIYSTDSVITGRGYLLFLKIPQEIHFPYNFDIKLKEYYNIGVFEFLATSFFEWFNCVGKSKKRNIQLDKLASLVTNQNQQIYKELFSLTSEEYKKMIRGEEEWKIANVEKDINGIEPFFAKPLIKSKTSNDLIAVHPSYLLYQVTMGIFYLLENKEKILSNSEKQNDFRNEFGNVYQYYASKLLSQVRSPAQFIDMDKKFGKEKGFPDFAIIHNEVCILFEIKTTLLKLETRSIFDPNKIEEEVKRDKGPFDKAIKQFNNFCSQIENIKLQENSLSAVNKMIKIIVGFDDILHANQMLLPVVKNHYGNKYGKSSVQNLHIITINELEIMAGVLENEIDFVKRFFILALFQYL